MSYQVPSWVQEVFETDRDVLYLLDAKFRIMECNLGWDKFAAENGGVGISRAEVRGRNVFEFIPEVLERFYQDKYSEALRVEHWIGFDCGITTALSTFVLTALLVQTAVHRSENERVNPISVPPGGSGPRRVYPRPAVAWTNRSFARACDRRCQQNRRTPWSSRSKPHSDRRFRIPDRAPPNTHLARSGENIAAQFKSMR